MSIHVENPDVDVPDLFDPYPDLDPDLRRDPDPDLRSGTILLLENL